MRENLRIGFVGAGNMATALARGLLSAGKIDADAIVASDVDADRRKAFSRATSASAVAKNAAVAQQADVLVLAVKPQQMKTVLSEIGTAVEERHLVISIAAGVTTAFIEKYLRNGIRLIRAMPNTPVLVGAGAVGICKGRWATDGDLDTARRIFESSAVVVSVDEKDLDAVTAVSGSGPAYFFYFTEALIEAGIDLGLAEEHARALAIQTAMGAGRMLAESGERPQELRRCVTSPGGTTEAAIAAMTDTQVRESIIAAVKAAARRSRELGELLA